jgi:hypothetical protein
MKTMLNDEHLLTKLQQTSHEVREAAHHLPQLNETLFESTFPGKYLCQIAAHFNLADRHLAERYPVFDDGRVISRDTESLSSSERAELARIMCWLAYGLTGFARNLQAQADGISGSRLAGEEEKEVTGDVLNVEDLLARVSEFSHTAEALNGELRRSAEVLKGRVAVLQAERDRQLKEGPLEIDAEVLPDDEL